MQRLLLAAMLGLLVGVLLGQPMLGVLLGVLLVHLWTLRAGDELLAWLQADAGTEPPDLPGQGNAICREIWRRRSRYRRRSKRWSRILERFRTVLAAVPDAAVMVDDEGRIEWSSRSARRVLGIRRRRDTGRPLTNLLRLQEVDRALRHTLEDNEQRTLEIISPLELQRELELRIIPCRDRHCLLFARDITSRRELQKAQRDFVANASHELRTPLTIFGSSLQIMDEDEHRPPSWQPLLDGMKQQLRRMQSLTDSLLELSALEQRALAQDTGTVALSRLLPAWTREVRQGHADQGREVTLEVQPDLLLRGHGEEIRSAYANLLDNALHHTPPGTRVQVRCYTDDRGLHLEVEDDGDGIPPEHLDHVIERFYRVNGGATPGNAGLGLAIVHEVLRRHDAELHIASTPGRGSLFHAHFPPARVAGHAAVPGQEV